MNNEQIAEYFSLLSKLMDIHGENSFRSKSYSIAAFTIDKLPQQLSETPKEKLAGIKGIGESTSKKIIELLETGELKTLSELIAKTPAGVMEMLSIKGLGPKKIATVWKEMEIETLGELLYACEENRLKLYKGFGEKTQQSISEAIEFYFRNKGRFLYSQVHAVEPQIKVYLEKLFSPGNVFVTGAYKRQLEIIDEMEYAVNSNNENIKPKFISANPPELLEEKSDTLLYKLTNGLRLRLYTGKENFKKHLFKYAASNEFIEAFMQEFSQADTEKIDNNDDKMLFETAGLHYIPPFARESATIIKRAKQQNLDSFIQPEDIKGIIHSHSNWSDGSNTIEEMAKAAADKGLEYLVISDHSKTAVYANGLTEERLKEQHIYIDELNTKLAPFKIFKSIESDILNDGSLDYSDSILSTFDMVIASVHSNLKMTEEKAMMRLMKAIENPYTTVLGHMTGRLLLSRKGYPVDHRKIVDACAANNVVIELNAHPNRLDIDWRHIDYALEKGVLISINPDAHYIEGFNDTYFGVLVAQKALVTKEQNLSSFSLVQLEQFLKKKKESRA
ncbi:MAG: helix-hairpin-helix domain-containing protein [Ferruginibacter sp.]